VEKRPKIDDVNDKRQQTTTDKTLIWI